MKVLLLLLAFAMLLTGGCGSTQTQNLLKSKDFIMVFKSEQMSFADVAMKHLGTVNKASIIKRLNPDLTDSSQGYVVIPKQAVFPRGVYFDKVQTIPILCYHRFTDVEDKVSPMVLHTSDFEKQLEYLDKNNFEVISVTDLYQFIQGKKDIPEKSVVITVDDGFKSFKTHALPLLERYQFSATVFVYPNFVGGRLALDWKQLNQLDAHPLVTIQSHSYTHDNLKKRPTEEESDEYKQRLKKEVIDAEKVISKRIGNSIKHFAYPFGDTSTELISMLNHRGYHLGYTVERGENVAFSNPYLLRRNMIFGTNNFDDFTKSLGYERALKTM